MRVQKKPVIVNAWPIEELLNIEDENLPPEVKQAFKDNILIIDYTVELDYHISVETLEGRMRGPVGWYLIQGIKGEWYPCDGEIFKDSYDILDSVDTVV